MKNILKVVLVIIGTLIGAGFASGKEIYVFFNKYGSCGLYGMILSGIILSLVIYKVLKLTKNNKIDEYNFYKYGSLPILFITARNYRIPLPSNIIYKFLEENDKE